MKLLLILTAGLLQAYGHGYSQSFTIQMKQVNLEKVFAAVETQSFYRFVFVKEELMGTKPVDISMINASLEEVMAFCLKDQPLRYELRDHYIIIQRKEVRKAVVDVTGLFAKLRGRVVNEEGEGIAGATIAVKNTKLATASNEQGVWELESNESNPVIIVTCVGYISRELRCPPGGVINITLTRSISSLDETVLIAYGKTTRRLNTGNVGRVAAEEISRQPVSNPLAALQARVSGLLITQTSGVPGAAFKIQIQGQQSIGAKGNLLTRLVTNDPLFIIDGVPYAPGNNNLNQLISAAGNPDEGYGLSPLQLINPADIESIEVLKDADATAIYGSRGANGVILVTTKKGKPGKTSIGLNIYTGFSKVTRTATMLNTRQYTEMRLEGIANDGAVLSNNFLDPGYAPDLLYWDTTRYTDWKKELIGGTAKISEIQVTLSGGAGRTRYFLSGGVHRENTVFPGDQTDNRLSVRFNLNHQSTDKKFSLGFSSGFSDDINKLAGTDLTRSIGLIPHLPGLTDSLGELKWEDNGIPYSSVGIVNPLAYLKQSYSGESRNLIGNLLLSYQFNQGPVIKISSGYNSTDFHESKLFPLSSQNPAVASSGRSSFGQRFSQSWVLEPQVEYTRLFRFGTVSILSGGTWQRTISRSALLEAEGYVNDNLLGSLSAAASIRGSNSFSDYRYGAFFGRINYNRSDKYLLNFSGRRDGSSRFGPGKQFAFFTAAGAAWIFSEEKFIRKKVKALSYGKLRFSYGSSGNDQIGDYKFMSTWRSNTAPYQQTAALIPTRLTNPDFAWEINRKLQAGLELGFFQDRLLLNLGYFRNRSNNQLVGYPLPSQTGFSTLAARNIPALVQNRGWEVFMEGKIINTRSFNWNAVLNITIGKNKLLSYPGLAFSSYSTTYVVGQPLNLIYKYDYLGVDPLTGLYQFRDLNNDGLLNSKDYVINGRLDPIFYGGLSHSVTYKRFGLQLLAEFRKQIGADYRFDITSSPGYFSNQPVDVLKRWRHPGDHSPIQMYSANSSGEASSKILRLAGSDGAYSDASFVRLKNLYLSYQLRDDKRLKSLSCRLYMQFQNLFTLSRYKGADPENQSLYRLPPLRTITAGIQITF
ncbi:MAG: SusC/RagA family TonB-linked outer membrane protein [Sphingobacteriales bacterium]|nr:SusC/RagA family TonB-linked outer membrane protein [Sphingobacteriales bacterium]